MYAGIFRPRKEVMERELKKSKKSFEAQVAAKEVLFVELFCFLFFFFIDFILLDFDRRTI